VKKIMQTSHRQPTVAGLAPRVAGGMLAALLMLGVAQAQLPPTQNINGVEYVSGGIGQEESSAFRQAKSQYPLALTFATVSEGSAASPFASNVQVVIRNRQDATVLNTNSDGPYLLARLEPGSYKVFATYEGQTQSRDITIKPSGTLDIKFTWKRPASGPD
jgi:hypothetical protein